MDETKVVFPKGTSLDDAIAYYNERAARIIKLQQELELVKVFIYLNWPDAKLGPIPDEKDRH